MRQILSTKFRIVRNNLVKIKQPIHKTYRFKKNDIQYKKFKILELTIDYTDFHRFERHFQVKCLKNAFYTEGSNS